jgi:hypothetical protein
MGEWISALVGGLWSASRPKRFTPGERVPGTHSIGGWVNARAGLDDVEKRQFLTLQELQSVASRYTDCAIPGKITKEIYSQDSRSPGWYIWTWSLPIRSQRSEAGEVCGSKRLWFAIVSEEAGSNFSVSIAPYNKTKTSSSWEVVLNPC